MVPLELYRELHDIVYHLGHNFRFITLLQVWVCKHIVVMRPVGRHDRDSVPLMVFSWGGGLKYEVVDDIDYWRVIFDRLIVEEITWRPYIVIVAWPEDPRHIPYMTTTGYKDSLVRFREYSRHHTDSDE